MIFLKGQCYGNKHLFYAIRVSSVTRYEQARQIQFSISKHCRYLLNISFKILHQRGYFFYNNNNTGYCRVRAVCGTSSNPGRQMTTERNSGCGRDGEGGEGAACCLGSYPHRGGGGATAPPAFSCMYTQAIDCILIFIFSKSQRYRES